MDHETRTLKVRLEFPNPDLDLKPEMYMHVGLNIPLGRRLVVPTTRFLDETFENWTKESAELLAPVILHLDPLARIEPLRAEFIHQAEAHALWDKRVARLQVTGEAPGSIVVRLLMSAANSGDAFDLRCDIREGILAWIREHQPEAIIRHRIESIHPALPEE